MKKNKYEKILSSVREHTSIFKAFENGMTPEQVKKDVIAAFSPYFQNKNVLEKQAIPLLVPELINFANILKDKWALELFEFAMRVYHGSKRQDSDKCFTAYSEWMLAKNEGLSKFWSQLHLEAEKSDLAIEEYTHEYLRNIGGLLEGCIKPYTNELLQQLSIFQGVPLKFKEIEELDFGEVINKLIKFSYPSNYFLIEDIKINQWRNIAQHLSVRFKGERIICSYGPKNRKEIILTKKTLHTVAMQVSLKFRSLSVASAIFSIDNLEDIHPKWLSLPEKVELRPETRILHLVTMIASQGFEVIDIQIDKKISKLIMRDATMMEPRQRSIHASQFIIELWRDTNSSIVTIDYLEHDGTPNLRATASAELFVRAFDNEQPLEIIAKEVEMIDLKKNLSIKKIDDK